jgi:hypothetical protein
MMAGLHGASGGLAWIESTHGQRVPNMVAPGSEADILQNTTKYAPVGMIMARDDFGGAMKEVLAKRVAHRCSNPTCRATTSGPHSEPSRAVNVGVAAHIAAASPGGPRFDAGQTPEERRSIENAIWLCQRCAKLVDSDVATFSASTLKDWKVTAEAEILRTIGVQPDDNYPQPGASQHVPVPRIAGQQYSVARDQLLRAGWQPITNSWSYADDLRIRYGNGPLMWARGYHELTDACPTGLAYCKFSYRDAYGNQLKVVTAGEAVGDDEDVAVWSWSIQSQEQLAADRREFLRLSAEVRQEIAQANEHTLRAARARRDLAVGSGGLGGSREKMYRTETDSRVQQLDVAAKKLKSIELEFDATDPSQHLSDLEVLMAEVRLLSTRSSEDFKAFDAERFRLLRGY